MASVVEEAVLVLDVVVVVVVAVVVVPVSLSELSLELESESDFLLAISFWSIALKLDLLRFEDKKIKAVVALFPPSHPFLQTAPIVLAREVSLSGVKSETNSYDPSGFGLILSWRVQQALFWPCCPQSQFQTDRATGFPPSPP